MRARPRKKHRRKHRFLRCPKCQKSIRMHQDRCSTCHRVQPVQTIIRGGGGK